MNLYTALQAAFPQERSAPFLHCEDGRVFTYGDLEMLSGQMARVLTDCGATPGERVAVQVEKSPEAVVLYLACLRVGAVYLPLNPAYTPEEARYFLTDAEPAVFICAPEREAELARIAKEVGVGWCLTLGVTGEGSLMGRVAEVFPADGAHVAQADDLAAILYTSGTTGRSKGAMISHGNLLSNARTLHRTWGFGPGDRLIHALPIYHTHGLFVALNTTLLNGSDMIFFAKFEAAKVMEAMARATMLMGVPTFYVRLLKEKGLTLEVCRNMRLFISGSAPLLEETFTAFAERTGHRILERYGMTETNMLTSNPLEGERRLKSVGPALPGISIRIAGEGGDILEPGEIGGVEVKGPNVFSGYWRMPDETREAFCPDGYFRTGDLGQLASDGYLTLVGRAKDLIISGGFNVYPKEVELVIDEMVGVVESAVIGVPHPDFGEGVVAVVVTEGAHDLTEESILESLAKSLARYKCPKRIFFVAALPRNAMGKVQKNVLREAYRNAFAP